MLGARRVLVFDDDDDARRVLRQSLAVEECDLRFAVQPAQALAVLSSMPVDIIIANQHMPNMTGLALLELVRERHPSCLRMLMAEELELETVARALTRGLVFRILFKPLNPTELLASLGSGCQFLDLRRENEQLSSMVLRQFEFIQVLEGQHPDTEQVLKTARQLTGVHVQTSQRRGTPRQGGKP